VTDVRTAPEPGTLALMAFALASGAVGQKFRKKRRAEGACIR
jgi:hypothetical protein